MKEHREQVDFDVIKWGPAHQLAQNLMEKSESFLRHQKRLKKRKVFFNRSFQEQS
jgi:hypothetical protein